MPTPLDREWTRKNVLSHVGTHRKLSLEVVPKPLRRVTELRFIRTVYANTGLGTGDPLEELSIDIYVRTQNHPIETGRFPFDPTRRPDARSGCVVGFRRADEFESHLSSKRYETFDQRGSQKVVDRGVQVEDSHGSGDLTRSPDPRPEASPVRP